MARACVWHAQAEAGAKPSGATMERAKDLKDENLGQWEVLSGRREDETLRRLHVHVHPLMRMACACVCGMCRCSRA